MEVSRVLSTVANQNNSLEQCSAVDKPSEGFGTIVSDTSAIYLDLPASSTLHSSGTDLHLIPRVDDTGSLRGAIVGENQQTELRISYKQLQVENSDCISGLDHGSFEDTYSHQSQSHTCEQLEAKYLDEVLSSAVANFQQISFVQEELGATPAEENPAVVIPHHLQVTNADCAHLSFGTFGSTGASFPVVRTFNLLEYNAEPLVVSENVSPTYQSGDRKLEYYNKDHLGSGLDNSLAPGRVTSSRNDDMTSVSKPEVIRENTYQSGDRKPYDKNDHLWCALDNSVAPGRVTSSRNDDMSSVSKPEVTRDETFDTVHRLHHEMSFIPRIFPAGDVEASSEVQNLSPGTSLLTLNPGLFSTLRPTPQIVSSTAIATGPAFPQNLHVHPYSQPSQSPGPLPNLISHPLLPQSIPSMQFAGRNAFHQSPAALQSAGMQYSFPQYKYDSLNGLPQSLPTALGYGGLGSANIPGSLSQNPSTVAFVRTAGGYEAVLRSQFREGDYFSLLNQSENSLRLHGAGSRTPRLFQVICTMPFRCRISKAGTYLGMFSNNLHRCGWWGTQIPCSLRLGDFLGNISSRQAKQT
ncbi:uncharacterized protein M6B38_338075 [Iris pallida]|uniref:Uncharacterized protein n=1 Tax=Iris pallida TaxID=29817 RepID=A0AAX6GZ96_IRIPA|nr:uncharacterized protein M6B38_338075 [Iris pallida]